MIMKSLGNGRRGLADPTSLITKRTFDHKGLRTTELIIRIGTGTVKVAWCRSPFGLEVVGGKPNFCHHSDFATSWGTDGLEAARRRCRESYESCNGLS